MNRWTLTVLVSIGLAGTVRSATAEPADPIAAAGQGQPTLVLHVVNYADLSRDVLDETKARVASVYEVIGVRIVWADDGKPKSPIQEGQFHLTVILLPREMAQKKISAEGIAEGVFGQAHPPSGRAHIFCDRIATMPGAPTYFAIPLGDVIAHEVGHLLLPANSHSRTGIMRANFDVRGIRLQSFDEKQARTIRAVLMNLAGPNP